MKDFTKISEIYNQRNYSVSSKADYFDIYENDYAPADYIEREQGKTIKDYNYSPGVGLPISPLLIVSIIIWIPAITGLAWMYESHGREAATMVTLLVALSWHVAKNRRFLKSEGLYISFSFYFCFFVALSAVNLVAQIYQIPQFGLDHFISHLNYFELLFQYSLIPALSVMAFVELLLHCLVDRGDDREEDDYADFIFFFDDNYK